MINTNNSKLNYNDYIKSNLKVVLSNRENATSYISWGSSVVIGLYHTKNISLGDTISFIDGGSNFTIYDKDDYNIYINMMSNDATPISFISVRQPSATTLRVNDSSTVFIRENDLYTTSNTISVKIRNLTIPNSLEFDGLFLKYGIKNKYYIYGLSEQDYSSINVEQLSNINFDIVLNDSDEDIILSNLKLIKKANNELIFKVDTNINDFYVYVDVDMVEDENSIYPDITFSENSLINISNKEIPILFDGQKSGYFVGYDTDRRSGLSSTVSTSIYCKPVLDSVKIYEFDGTTESYNTLPIPKPHEINQEFTGVTYTESKLMGDFRNFYNINDFIDVDGSIYKVIDINSSYITTSTPGIHTPTVTIKNSFKINFHSIDFTFTNVGSLVTINKKVGFMFSVGDYVEVGGVRLKILNVNDLATSVELTLSAIPTTTTLSIAFKVYNFKNLTYLAVENKYYAKLLNLTDLFNISKFTNGASEREFREIYLESDNGIETFSFMNNITLSANQEKLIYTVI